MDKPKPKVFRYKGVQINKPENISITEFKQVVDECGKDFSFDVQKVIDFISRKYKK